MIVMINLILFNNIFLFAHHREFDFDWKFVGLCKIENCFKFTVSLWVTCYYFFFILSITLPVVFNIYDSCKVINNLNVLA